MWGDIGNSIKRFDSKLQGKPKWTIGYGKQDILSENARRLLPISGGILNKQRVSTGGWFRFTSIQSKSP